MAISRSAQGIASSSLPFPLYSHVPKSDVLRHPTHFRSVCRCLFPCRLSWRPRRLSALFTDLEPMPRTSPAALLSSPSPHPSSFFRFPSSLSGAGSAYLRDPHAEVRPDLSCRLPLAYGRAALSPSRAPCACLRRSLVLPWPRLTASKSGNDCGWLSRFLSISIVHPHADQRFLVPRGDYVQEASD